MAAPLPDDIVDQIANDLFAGRKIDAIKTHRLATGFGLKESKDFIDALEARLRQESPEKFTAPPGGAGCTSSAARLLIIAVVVYSIARCWI